MARIPENEIERLKSEVSVERLVEASGVALKKAGKDFIGCCPFHADDMASLVIRKAVWLGKGEARAAPHAVPVAGVTEQVKDETPALVDEAASVPSLSAVSVLPASPVPATAAEDIPCEVKDNEILLTLGDRRWHVRGLAKGIVCATDRFYAVISNSKSNTV